MSIENQTTDVVIHNLVNLLRSYDVKIPPELQDEQDDHRILNTLIALVQDNNLEYDRMHSSSFGTGAVMKPVVRQAYLTQYQLKRGASL